jgi:hypothetical protein
MCEGCCDKECCTCETETTEPSSYRNQYNKAYSNVYENILEKLPDVEAAVDALCDTIDGNRLLANKLGGLLAEASGFVGIYVKEIVASAYEGRAEGLIKSYDILEQKFGHDLAIDLIKKVA